MREIKNIPASVSERLKNIARENGKAFDVILLLYFQERFLYRLSQSEYQENFVLKGGLYLFSLTGFQARPTKDIDFLGKKIANNLEELKRAFEHISSIEVLSDGVVFAYDQVTTERIKEDVDYEGVRVKIPTYLGKMKKILQLDIGFEDVIVPKPRQIDYPVLLELEVPIVQAYSLESVISEKFEAMISLSILNSRMKDFYDIFMLLNSEDFDGRVLWEAVQETFERRGTSFENGHPLFTKGFALDDNRNKQWEAFVRRTGLESSLKFNEIMDAINVFLYPLYKSLASEEEFFKLWKHEFKEWV